MRRRWGVVASTRDDTLRDELLLYLLHVFLRLQPAVWLDAGSGLLLLQPGTVVAVAAVAPWSVTHCRALSFRKAEI